MGRLRHYFLTLTCSDLFEYLLGFSYTSAVLQTAANLERVAYEVGVDCFSENCRYVCRQHSHLLHKLALRFTKGAESSRKHLQFFQPAIIRTDSKPKPVEIQRGWSEALLERARGVDVPRRTLAYARAHALIVLIAVVQVH